MSVFINAVSTALPENQVTNEDLQKNFKLPKEWIESTTGNQKRNYAFNLETKEITDSVVDMAFNASVKLIENNEDQIDAIILASGTPDHLIPTTVNLLADRLKLNNIKTFQLLAGCSGAVQIIQLAKTLLLDKTIRKVLVVGVDSVAKFIDLERGTNQMKGSELVNYALFGDGAGAAILSRESHGVRVVKTINRVVGAEQEGAQVINWFGFVPLKPENVSTREWRKKYVSASENYQKIKEKVPELTNHILNELVGNDFVEYYLPPQLNKIMTDSIVETSKINYSTLINVVENVGNCGNALPFFQIEKLFEMIKKDEQACCIAIESSKWIETGLLLEGC